MSGSIQLRRVARMAYGDALAAESRIEGAYPVVGSGGASGTHNQRNFGAPGIVIGRKGSYGSIHWVPSGGFAIDTAYYIDNSSTSADLRWLYYALKAVDIKGASQDVGVPGLSREAAYAVSIPTPPPLEEQRRIADFLDAETARIDKLVSLRKRQMVLIDEHYESALEREFNADDSFRETRLKYLLSMRPRYGVLVPSFVDEGIPFIRVNDLLDLAGRSKEMLRIPGELSAQYSRTVTREGDVLLSVVGTLGRSAIVPSELAGANVNRAIAVLRPLGEVSNELLAKWLTTRSFFRQALGATASDTAQRTLGMEDLSNFRLPWPNQTADMERLSAAVQAASDRRSKLLNVFQRQVTLLEERRQALITAAVTGQFDVSTASGREIEE